MKKKSMFMIFVLSTSLSVAYPGDASAIGGKTFRRMQQKLKSVIAPSTVVVKKRAGNDKPERALNNFKEFVRATRTNEGYRDILHEFNAAVKTGPVKLVNITGKRRVLKIQPLYEGETFAAVATDTMSIFRHSTYKNKTTHLAMNATLPRGAALAYVKSKEMFKDKAMRKAIGDAAYVTFISNTPGSKDGQILFCSSPLTSAGIEVNGKFKSASFPANADQFFPLVKAAKKLAE